MFAVKYWKREKHWNTEWGGERNIKRTTCNILRYPTLINFLEIWMKVCLSRYQFTLFWNKKKYFNYSLVGLHLSRIYIIDTDASAKWYVQFIHTFHSIIPSLLTIYNWSARILFGMKSGQKPPSIFPIVKNAITWKSILYYQTFNILLICMAIL